MANTNTIKIDNVFFAYPDGHEVLKGVSCTIAHGEKVALIGANGAGKSTLMSHLNGVQLATSGAVNIDGLEISRDNLKSIRRKVGIVFQDPDDQLFCPTVFDDVAFGPLNLDLPKDEINIRVKDALAIVGLEGFEERSSFHLSFGERKRLALATVLSYQPDILVFDEPSTNMDPLNRRNLIKWLQNCDKTVLLCTHDLDIALEVCSRCLVLADGKIVADGPTSSILYDRKLLEANNLELPLALMTHELLHDMLHLQDMNEEHRVIIGNFLHTHRHVHDSGHIHLHVHAHPHEHQHLHESVGDGHLHELDHHADGHTHDHDGIPHSHDKEAAHHEPAAHEEADVHYHDGKAHIHGEDGEVHYLDEELQSDVMDKKDQKN